jgi:Ca-activated chloride channel homolog
VNWLAPYLGIVEQPAWLAGVIILPLVVTALLVHRERDRRRRIARLGDPATISRILPTVPSIGAGTRCVLLALALAGCAIAFAGPRWGAERTIVRTAGADVVVAVDASLSMLATDERPSRLERAKQDIRRLRALSPGDRTALIAFAGRSYILSPLTIDDGALSLFLDNLDPSVVGQPGTSIARAIRQGTDLLLATRTTSDRALVILSDGEGWESEEDIRAAATQAKDNGITLVTVGYGTEQGSNIPLASPSGMALKRDEEGAVVVTRYSPTLLQAAAEAAGGTFIPASATDKPANVRRALAKLRVARRTIDEGDQRTPRFQYFLAPALILLLIDTFSSDPRLSRRRSERPTRGIAHALPPRAAAMLIFSGLLPLISPPRTTAAERAAAYRRAIDAGDHTPQTLYNYGTALLAADSIESAISILSQAADARDGDVRYRSWFNLGLAHLHRGLAAQGDSGAPDLDAALDAYKRVLIGRPQDADARWNYELALRTRRGGGGGSGGGAGGANAPQPTPNNSAAGQGLAQRQAEELLNNAAREEREVQSKVQRQAQTEVPPGGRDW